MKIVFTGGGTGGHIYPALAVATEIKRRKPETEIMFVGTRTGIEAKAVPSAGFPFFHIHARGLSGNPIKILSAVFFTSIGFLQSLFFISKKKPGLIVGSGGYVSGPVVLAGVLLGIPVVLLEQNALPGKTNRFLAQYSKKVLTSFAESEKYLPQGKAVFTGNPVRREIGEKKREDAVKELNLNPSLFTLLITGASQGARSINEAILNALPLWKDREWQIIHLVGRNNYQEFKQNIDPLIKDFRGEYRCLDYSEDMASLYAVADMIVARAGASTLAEITLRGIPSVLIPYPYSADNHQEKNAMELEKAGGAIVLSDRDVRDKLGMAVQEIAGDENRRQNMAENCKKMGKPSALEQIADEVEGILITTV